MTKGKLIASAAHVAGVFVAMLLLWALPGKYLGPLAEAKQYLAFALFAWGSYKLYQILQGRDVIGKKTEAHFDQKTGDKK
ncbi:hypothetical protein ACIPLR_17615 [Herbaspirillum huttiense]|uniref:hypothetical protein n=1 Tax=Herbaspirillum huttiense TaxID=863372 RepID=UPI00380ED57C